MTTSQLQTRQHHRSAGAVGVIVTAAVLMVIIGILHVIQGVVALANDTFFVLTPDYVFKYDLTGWGWAHLIIGVIVAVAGFALFAGQVWARTVAVAVASVSILASFVWLPYYPIWNLILITFGAFVIWAVTAHGRDLAEA